MPTKQTRAAVVGATSVLAKELLEELNSSPAAAWDIQLLDVGEGEETQLSVAGDEPVVIQPLSQEALQGMDFVFFAGDAETARTWAGTAREAGAAAVDLTGALGSPEDFLMRSPWLAGGTRPDLTTVGIAVPHPISLILGLLAQRLEGAFGLTSLVATVLEPASQAGRAALDELHQQTVSLLSFQSVPKEIYDSQVAFNLQSTLGEAARVDLRGTAMTVREEMASLLGALAERVHFQLIQAPVFHGYTSSALVTLTRETSLEQIRESLHGGVMQAERETLPSNTAVVESGDLMIAITPEQAGDRGTAYWLWMAADNLRFHARSAVAAAMELAALRPVTTMQ